MKFFCVLLLGGAAFALNPAPGPARLIITPGDRLIAPSSQQQLEATISFFGGFASPAAQRDVTNSVLWSSSDKDLADVNGGLVTATAQTGVVMITAVSGPLHASVPLTVSTATLSSISMTPGPISVPLGRHQQFTATGNYSDSSHHDLTTAAGWSSDATSVASVNAFGLSATHAKGQANITANFAGKNGSAALTVIDPALDFISVAPSNPVITYPPSLQLTATGVYSDGSTANLTASTTWSSSNIAAATVNATGTVSSKDLGTTTVSASASGMTGATQVTVAALPIGTVSAVTTLACPSGGVSGTCTSLNVSCPLVPDQNVIVKVAPAQETAKGTVILIGGGGSNGFFDAGYTFGAMITSSLQNAGFNVAILEFNDPNLGWLTGPGGARHLACRPATVIAWVRDNVHQGGASAPFCAAGESGGSSAIAYSLSHYGLGEILSMAEEAAGPPFARIDHGCICDQSPIVGPCSAKPITTCYFSVDNDVTGFIDTTYNAPLCSTAAATGATTNAALFLSDSILFGSQLTAFPKTDVHFIFGGRDLTLAVPEGMEFEQSLTTTKSVQCVANSGHSMPNFIDGANQILNDLLTSCKLQ